MKYFCFVLFQMAILLPVSRAANEPWIGSDLTVRATFLLHHIKGTTPPKPIGVLLMPGIPMQLIDARIEGKVRVKFTVDIKGEVKELSILACDPSYQSFGDEVIRVVRQWNFTAATGMADQKKVPVEVECLFQFGIGENPEISVQTKN